MVAQAESTVVVSGKHDVCCPECQPIPGIAGVERSQHKRHQSGKTLRAHLCSELSADSFSSKKQSVGFGGRKWNVHYDPL